MNDGWREWVCDGGREGGREGESEGGGMEGDSELVRE